MKTPVYLDYASTTPVDPEVVAVMTQFLSMEGQFGNPASRSHRFGWQAEEAVDIARNQVAQAIGADAREIVFTSGATESDNLAIKGVMLAAPNTRRHMITVATEHKAVLDTCEYLEGQGIAVTYLTPRSDGLIELSDLANAITQETRMISVMAVNNETGVQQDLAAIAKLCRQHDVIFHVDAAQAVGKMAFNVAALDIDLASFSAHKVYGPKGIGALYVKRRADLSLQALIHGGGHERGMRSGTLATHQIAGMGKAFELAAEKLKAELAHYAELRAIVQSGLDAIAGVVINGHPSQVVPNIINFSVADVDGETLLMSLYNLAVSSGSACNSATVAPSFVLKAMGLSDQMALNAIRLSVGRFTTVEDVNYAVVELKQVIEQLRGL